MRSTIKKLQNQVHYLTGRITSLEEKHATEKVNLLDNISLDDFKMLVHKFSPTQTIAEFINTQVTEGQKKPRGRRFTKEFKNECLKMYFTGPKLYKNYLVRTFCLPSARVLLHHIENIKVNPGLNDILLSLIKLKTDNFSHFDKTCIICFDEMSVKAN